MKKTTLIMFALVAFVMMAGAQSQYVNPFVGTDGHGHTYPGAILPFGAVQLSPDTRLDGWDGCSGYHYSDSRIYGFSHTHLSGTGCSDYGDILVTPFIGEPSVINEKYALEFSHEQEKAEPGYYSVKFKNGIQAEMTAANYVGVHRYTFPKNGKHGIIVDLQHRDKTLESYITLKANDLVGYRRSEAWNDDQYCAFSLKTSVPAESVVYYKDDKPVNIKEVKGTNCKAVLYFPENTKSVVVKVAISAVDMDGAVNNQTEVRDFDFEKVRKNATASWNNELGKIKVTSKNEEYLKTFYTALYHCFTSPYLYSDLDGRYRGEDQKIHNADKGHKMYTVFSLWDTYRALHPLLNIIDQQRSGDFLYTFLNQFRQSGYLPMWELSSQETWCMIGYHAVPVIWDAYTKGIHDYDAQEMLKAMIVTANLNKLGRPEYAKFGFVPGDMENESVSKTLEYAYDDWCIAMFAKAIGNQDVFKEYTFRAQSYKNLIDNNGFMHGKMNGGFAIPFNPREVNNFYTEANCWQYTTYVPHDFNSYIGIMGGAKNMELFLDKLFNSSSNMSGRVQSDITGVIGQYAHGNEPSHHAAYLYNYVGRPDKTQALVKKILTSLYTSKPDGLCGNEDCGQMSAWYVFSAMGFYPVCPGSNQYVIGYPLFDKVELKLENGKTLTINRKNDSPYIQSVTIDGKPLTRSYITYEEIANGGVIEFTMGDDPNSIWGKGKGEGPVSKIAEVASIVPVPVFSTDKVSFRDQTRVALSVPKVTDVTSERKDANAAKRKDVGDSKRIMDNAINVDKAKNADINPNKDTKQGDTKMPSKETMPLTKGNIMLQKESLSLKKQSGSFGDYVIYYTLDGSNPSPKTGIQYTEPIKLDKDVTVKAVAVDAKGRMSQVAEAHYVRYVRDKDITYITKPDNQYYAGGNEGLIDNSRGKVNYRIGGWQGFTTDCELVIDLREAKKITTVGAGVLEEQRAWIFYPKGMEVYVSDDGKSYKPFGQMNVTGNKTEGAHIQDLEVKGKANARYVKIVIKNYGKLPEWHLSAGEQAWLFVDEVWVR
ncbi:MAG: GH92 family glycosyl hydrolase [Bacteroidales bacterium]|nr:GH92 family glycosyl hydrolase [Bacteroidales bacterium]